MALTIDEKNDLDRLDRIEKIIDESIDRPGIINFMEIKKICQITREVIFIKIGKRIIMEENETE